MNTSQCIPLRHPTAHRATSQGIMQDLTTIQDIGFEDLLALVTNALASEQSRRAYARALRSFFEWYFATPRGPLSKALVLEYKSHLRARQYSSATVNLHLSAIRKLAQEASDNELLDASVAGAIGRVRGSCIRGVRTGNWLGHGRPNICSICQTPPPLKENGTPRFSRCCWAVPCAGTNSQY